MTKELAVIVPTFNENNNIENLVKKLESSLHDIKWEVIFVDDDSPDGTAQTARNLAQHNENVRCIQRLQRKGLASACIEGMLSTSAPYLAVIDGDMQHDISLLNSFYCRLKNEDKDIVIGSRYMDGGSTGDGLSSRRQLASRFACWMSSKLLKANHSDPMSGFFVMRRTVLDACVHNLYGKGFKILLDILVCSKDDIQVIEHPYTMQKRIHGSSKIGLLVMYEFINLVANRLIGKLIPPRFFLFIGVGFSGVIVHLSILKIMFNASDPNFIFSQSMATVVAMTSNFFINNAVTYHDKRLNGKAMFHGLLSFYLTCSFGALISISLGEFLFERVFPYWLAGLTGAIVASIWNFALTAKFTWGKKI